MKKIIIVGAVAAGLKTAAEIRRCDPEASITVIEKGELISYGACGMPYFVSGDVPSIEHLMATASGEIRDAGYFSRARNINVLTRTKATKIDRHNKKLAIIDLKTGSETLLSYDKLVLATGASPIQPDIPGVQLQNIFHFWHPDDAKTIHDGLQENRFKKAVIIGVGLVGMEMTEALKTRNADVTVIARRDQLLRAFLDKEMAEPVAKHLADKGVTVLTDEAIKEFRGSQAVQEVITDKRSIPADLVILAIGVKPNVDLAQEAGLAIGPTGAIAVNEHLQTSDPDIYAGGDCVENTNLISGRKVFAPMGSTANKHGRVIGENICGGSTIFRGVLNTVVLKIFDLNVGRVGLTEREAKDLGYDYLATTVSGYDKPHYMPGAQSLTLKLIADAKTRRVLGAQACGRGEVAKRIDVIAMNMTAGGTIDDLFDCDLSYAPPYNTPIDITAMASIILSNKLARRSAGTMRR